MKTYGLALALLLYSTCSMAEVKPMPQSSWPSTVAEAVPHILGSLSLTQRSIIGGTSKGNLYLFMGDWGEDIQVLLGLKRGNTTLVQTSCGQPCTAEQATLKLMEAAWDALPR